MSSVDSSANGRQQRPNPRSRIIAPTRSLESLVGAHPDALRDIFGSGDVFDPSQLGKSEGRLLSVESLASTFMLTRPLVKLASKLDPWRGKHFERGGTAGKDLLFNLRAFRFRCEVGPSRLDGSDALVIAYDGLGNPWPVSGATAELRQVGDTTAVGPAWVGGILLCWWGLTISAF